MKDLVLRFKTPASNFGNNSLEGLISGNGKTIFNSRGGVFLNEISFYSNILYAGGKRGVLPDCSDSVKAVQRLIKEKNKMAAETELTNSLTKKGYNVVLPDILNLANLTIKTISAERLTGYERTLNLKNGEITDYYKIGNTKYTRRCFISRVTNFFVLEITKQGEGKINSVFNLKNSNNVIKYESNFAYASGKNDDGNDYGIVLRVERTGGTLMTNAISGIKIEGADKITITGKVFTGANKEKEFFNIKNELNLNKLPYDKLLKEHTNEHNKLFDKSDISLADNNTSYIEDLINISGDTVAAELIEKLWYYGKFLMIIQYSEGGSVFNPHLGFSNGFTETSGIFLEDLLKRVYSGAIMLNNKEQLLNIFSYYEKNYDDLKKNASRLFGSRGIAATSISSQVTAVPFDITKERINSLSVTAMLANLYYAYYLNTKDDKFLKSRAIPFMKDAAVFYADLIEKDIYFGNYYKAAKQLFKNFIFESERMTINKVELNIVKDADNKLNANAFTQDLLGNKTINLIDEGIAEVQLGNLSTVCDKILDIIKYSMRKNLSVLESNFDGSFNGEVLGQPKVKLDGNVGLTNLISNIFLNTSGNVVSINAAHKIFNKYQISSFVTENGYEISLEYVQKIGLNVKLKSLVGGLILIKLPEDLKKVKGSVEPDYDQKERLITLNLAAGKTVSFTVM